MSSRLLPLTAVLAALLLPAALPPATAETPGIYAAPKTCELGAMGPGLCHVGHDLGTVPRVAFCQPLIHASGQPWACSVVEKSSSGVTIKATRPDGSPRTGRVRFDLMAGA